MVFGPRLVYDVTYHPLFDRTPDERSVVLERLVPGAEVYGWLGQRWYRADRLDKAAQTAVTHWRVDVALHTAWRVEEEIRPLGIILSQTAYEVDGVYATVFADVHKEWLYDYGLQLCRAAVQRGELTQRFLDEAKPYQVRAAAWTATRPWALFTWRTGSGKTAGALAALAARPQHLKALIVCPAAARKEWCTDPDTRTKRLPTSIEKYSNMDVHRILPEGERRKGYEELDSYLKRVVGERKRPVVVVGQESLPDYVSDIRGYGPDILIVDECHKLGDPHLLDVVVGIDGNNTFKKAETETGAHTRAVAINDVSRLRSIQMRLSLSVGFDTTVELRGAMFGNGWIGTMEAAWLRASTTLDVEVEGKYELLHLYSSVECRGWTGLAFGWKPVHTLIRHVAPSTILNIHVGGDRLRITPEHSVYTTVAGPVAEIQYGHEKYAARVVEAQAGALVKSAVLLLDDGNAWDETQVSPIDMIQVLKGERDVFVNVPFIPDEARAFLDDDAWYRARKSKMGPRLPVDVFLTHRDVLPPATRVYMKRGRGCSSAIQIPPQEMAYILGFFLGNGSVHETRAMFTAKLSGVDKITKALKDVTFIDLDPTPSPLASDQCMEIRCNCLPLVKFLYACGVVHPSYEKVLPASWIISWPRRAREELLQGLIDTDGHVHAKTGMCYYSTTSLSLAKSLLVLVRSLGAYAGLSRKKGTLEGGVIRGRQVIGTHAAYMVYWKISAVHGEPYKTRYAKGIIRFHEAPIRKVNVEATSPGEYVYDFEVDHAHPSFTANGLLAHNSATPLDDGKPRRLWAPLNITSPGGFGRFGSAYAYRFCNKRIDERGYPNDSGAAHMDELKRRCAFFLYDVPREESHGAMKNKLRLEVDYLKPHELNAPDAFTRELKTLARRAATDRDDRDGGSRMLLREARLAQACSMKKNAILGRSRDALLANNHDKVMIYVARRNMAEAWGEALKGSGQGWVAHGGFGPQECDRIVDAYAVHEGPCWLVGTWDAIGESKNGMQCTTLGIVAQLPVKPSQWIQGIGRWDRMDGVGTIVWVPVAEGTQDDQEISRLTRKFGPIAAFISSPELAETADKLEGLDDDALMTSIIDKILNGGKD